MKTPRIFIRWAVPTLFLFALVGGMTSAPQEALASGAEIRRLMDPRAGDPDEPTGDYELPEGAVFPFGESAVDVPKRQTLPRAWSLFLVFLDSRSSLFQH